MCRATVPARIGISGAPGVGKTALVEGLGKALLGAVELAAATDMAAALAHDGVRINRESETEDYLAFLASHVRNMRLLEGDVVVFDRTILDVLAFMEINGHASGWLASLVEELVKWQMPLISAYFYIPPEFAVMDDGIRIVDASTIRELDTAIVRLLNHYRPDFVTLRGSLSERLGRLLEEIRRLGLRVEDR